MCSIGAVSATSQNLKLFFSLDLKYSQTQAANVLSLILAASIFGRLFMGWLADKIEKKYVMLLIYCLVASAIPSALFCHNPRGDLCLCDRFRNRFGRRLYDHPTHGSRVIWRESDGPGNGYCLNRRWPCRSNHALDGGMDQGYQRKLCQWLLCIDRVSNCWYHYRYPHTEADAHELTQVCD
jgi:hypothetical protein